MVVDQLQKLMNHQRAPSSKMFLLSWTLTQSIVNIVHHGVKANRALIKLLWREISPSTYPIVISVDVYPTQRDLVAMSRAITYHFVRCC